MCLYSPTQTSLFQHTTNTEYHQFLKKGNYIIITDLQAVKEKDEEVKNSALPQAKWDNTRGCQLQITWKKSCPLTIKSRFGTSIRKACLRAHHHPAGGPRMGFSFPECRFYPSL